MILTEVHSIRCRKENKLFRRIDEYCYQSKNLHNSVNYIISQCSRISRKLSQEKDLEDWEKEMLDEINTAVYDYNHRPAKNKKQEISAGKETGLRQIDADNGFIADPYFLSWYMKGKEVYKALPSATCSQICIQEVCRNWKSFFKSISDYCKNPGKYPGMPRKPSYLDKTTGRNPIVLTSQRVKTDESIIFIFLHF